MGTFAEINALLDRIPIWKRLQSVPKEVDELRKRIEKLESHLEQNIDGETCPICKKGSMDTIDISSDPVFGDLGLQEHTLRCSSCRRTEKRQFDPNKR